MHPIAIPQTNHTATSTPACPHTGSTITRQTACRHTFRTIHPPARHPAGTRLAAGLPVPPAFAFLPPRNRPVRHANRTGNPLTPPSDPSGLTPPQKCTNVSTVTNRNKNSALPMNAPSSPYTLLNHEKRPSTPAVAGVFLCAGQMPSRRHGDHCNRTPYRTGPTHIRIPVHTSHIAIGEPSHHPHHLHHLHHLHHPHIHPATPDRHTTRGRLAGSPPVFAFHPPQNRPVRRANRTGNPLTPPSDPSGLTPPKKCIKCIVCNEP